jgi:hypothetical protein
MSALRQVRGGCSPLEQMGCSDCGARPGSHLRNGHLPEDYFIVLVMRVDEVNKGPANAVVLLEYGSHAVGAFLKNGGAHSILGDTQPHH